MQTGTVTAGPLADAALISAVRDGDAAGFVVLVGRHAPAIRRFTRILDPLRLAGDLASDALATACTSLAHGHGPGLTLRPYLLLLVRHLYDARVAGLVDPFLGVEAVFAVRPFTDHATSRRPGRDVLATVAELPEAWQAALWHLGVEQDTHEEVARLLGVPAAAVGEIAARACAAVAGERPTARLDEIGRVLAAHLLGDSAAEYLTLARARPGHREAPSVPAPRPPESPESPDGSRAQ